MSSLIPKLDFERSSEDKKKYEYIKCIICNADSPSWEGLVNTIGEILPPKPVANSY